MQDLHTRQLYNPINLSALCFIWVFPCRCFGSGKRFSDTLKGATGNFSPLESATEYSEQIKRNVEWRLKHMTLYCECWVSELDAVASWRTASAKLILDTTRNPVWRPPLPELSHHVLFLRGPQSIFSISRTEKISILYIAYFNPNWSLLPYIKSNKQATKGGFLFCVTKCRSAVEPLQWFCFFNQTVAKSVGVFSLKVSNSRTEVASSKHFTHHAFGRLQKPAHLKNLGNGLSLYIKRDVSYLSFISSYFLSRLWTLNISPGGFHHHKLLKVTETGALRSTSHRYFALIAPQENQS